MGRKSRAKRERDPRDGAAPDDVKAVDLAMAGVEDPRFLATLDVLRRTGMVSFQLRYHDDEDPVVWIAVGEWNRGADGIPVPANAAGARVFDAAAAIDPYRAAVRLAESVMDGGFCVHCKRPTGITEEWRSDMPLADVVCWAVYDPELQKYRRSCEGDT